jgi:predicted amidohydrolase
LDGVVRVAVAQVTGGLDKAANLARVTAGIESAAEAGADLVVAPEVVMHDFGPPDLALAPVAEPIDGPFVSSLAQVAARRAITVLAGMFEVADGDTDRVYNTVVAIGADGGLIGRYRKQHLFDALGWVESDKLVAGEPEDRLVFECADMTVGVMTCYDIRFPELARALVDDGATLLAIPSAWVAGEGKPEQWRALATARAIEDVCYVAGAVQGGPLYTGGSLVVDPWGRVLASVDGDRDGLAAADISADEVRACRERMPTLANRRWRVEPR